MSTETDRYALDVESRDCKKRKAVVSATSGGEGWRSHRKWNPPRELLRNMETNLKRTQET